MEENVAAGEALNTPAPELVEGAPEGVEGESPTPKPVPTEDSKSKDSETVPYSRFKEVNEKANRWGQLQGTLSSVLSRSLPPRPLQLRSQQAKRGILIPRSSPRWKLSSDLKWRLKSARSE